MSDKGLTVAEMARDLVDELIREGEYDSDDYSSGENRIIDLFYTAALKGATKEMDKLQKKWEK